MPARTRGIKNYSSEELRLLVTEGRLKGHGVGRLVSVLSKRGTMDRRVARDLFQARVAALPCWSPPVPLLRTFLDLVEIPSPSG